MKLVKSIPFIVALVIYFSNAYADEGYLSALQLVMVCEKDRKMCNSLFRGMIEGLEVGSMIGGMNVGKQLVGEESESYSKLKALVNSNNSVFIGYCGTSNLTLGDMKKIFIDYVNKNDYVKSKAAALAMIYSLKESHPLPCQHKRKKVSP